ncbi:Nuclear transport factor 2 (NTF2) family protein [Rhynchospora pubera]|uniref:Nuclear transport factor 2 (NTF2) family protein n=1 Tax=Rhynchospora pubera TaxID=906938 RepID=A0AAV8G6A8_9POAL|nr:Nuclear transport factor 2 (NTF2) family protein [Rhynchospora pubera]
MASFLRPNPTSHLEPTRFATSRYLNSRRHCCNIKLKAKKNGLSDSAGSSQSENAVLKVAWYGSELLGIAASFFRPGSSTETSEEITRDGGELECFGRPQVIEAIKEDFERSYFVTGNLTLKAYEDDCEFADPAGSFRGLKRFKRNCTNFGSLLEKSNMNLMKWEDHEDKSIGHWRFSCVMSFPWRPILSATGYTEYYFDANSGRICRHVEHWNVPKMALLKQIFRPSRWFWEKR